MFDVECLVARYWTIVIGIQRRDYLLCGISLLNLFLEKIEFSRLLIHIAHAYVMKQLLIHKQVPVYIAEITPKNLRGRFTSANQV